MKIHEKYTNSIKKGKKPEEEADKVEISVDNYVLCEVLSDLTNQIRRLSLR